VEDGHPAGKDHTLDGVNKVTLDYAYLRDHRHTAGEEPRPIVVGIDRTHKWVMGDMVTGKGENWYAIQKVCQNVKDALGYNRLILKGDQEPALRTLLDRIKDQGKFEILPERAPVGDSQSNGEVENTGKRIQGQARTVKLGLEARIKGEIPEEHDIVPWIVRAGVATLNRYAVGYDGKTPWERLKGRPFNKEGAEFGETVCYLK